MRTPGPDTPRDYIRLPLNCRADAILPKPVNPRQNHVKGPRVCQGLSAHCQGLRQHHSPVDTPPYPSKRATNRYGGVDTLIWGCRHPYVGGRGWFGLSDLLWFVVGCCDMGVPTTPCRVVGGVDSQKVRRFADDGIPPNRSNHLPNTLVVAKFNLSSSIAIPRCSFKS
jgi:hypothetical protein